MKKIKLTVTYTTRIIFMLIFLSFIPLNAQTLRIEVSELLNNPSKYKLVDTRDTKKYRSGHIPNALNLPVTLTYKDKKIDGKIVQPSKMQKIVQKLGLSKHDTIVIYDDGTFFDSARVFWALEVYGFENVRLLNGGIEQWMQKNQSLTTIVPKIEMGNYIVSVNNNRIATKFSTQIATKSPNQTILDARGKKAYTGEISMAKRFGHIPSAYYIPATKNIDYSKKISHLQEKKDLRKIYFKINKNNKVIVYCAIGRIASLNYFVLRELGYDVSNYDASWKEWGNDFNLDIVNLSKK